MDCAAEREAAFGEGFDMATESHKEAMDILRGRIAELEAALRAVHVSTQNALWRNTALAHENAAKEILGLTSDYTSEEG